MGRLLPSSLDSRTDAADRDAEPRVVGLDDDETGAVVSALSSDTARGLLAALHDEPGTASTVADDVDTSLQNAQYHLDRMRDAGLVEVVDTVYSEKGREMKVYAPADEPLVVFAGTESSERGLRERLRGLVAALGVFAGLSAVVEYVMRDGAWLGVLGGTGGAAGDGGGVSTEAVETTSAAETATGLPPGLLFLAGGIVALALVVGVRYAAANTG
ncbi:MAG: transcriptional regulator, ArsR family [uncultured archaeon A07HB70]|nr:MAG: transcriptional regulator, ArsR family [uncultured archaeon A07HB70]